MSSEEKSDTGYLAASVDQELHKEAILKAKCPFPTEGETGELRKASQSKGKTNRNSCIL